MNSLFALLSVSIVSLLSFLGAFFLIFKKSLLHTFIDYALAISSGVLLGSAFLDLLPESVVSVKGLTYPLVLSGIVFFFSIEKLMQWHHHVSGDHGGEEKPVAYLSLIGDGIHNFIDGVIIGSAYLISLPLGITTTLAIVAHEIPHELADFSILLHGGFTPKKALLFNFLSALTAVAGTLAILVLSEKIIFVSPFLLPFAAGNFIYIAASDLIPELHKKHQARESVVQIVLLSFGILFIALSMYLLKGV